MVPTSSDASPKRLKFDRSEWLIENVLFNQQENQEISVQKLAPGQALFESLGSWGGWPNYGLCQRGRMSPEQTPPGHPSGNWARLKDLSFFRRQRREPLVESGQGRLPRRAHHPGDARMI